MRVFVTGATGFVGSAIVQELINAGHQALGLARNADAADALAKAGVEAHRGELTDTEGLAAGARGCDGVIHTAFIRDFSQFEANARIDRRAIEAIGAALEGSGRPFVVASGTAGRGGFVTEDDKGDPTSPVAARLGSETAALSMASHGVRASVVRLSPSTHDPVRQGFVTSMIAIAREKRVSAFVGDGLNRWPAVHRLDAANLFRLALEKGVAGLRYHAVAEEGVRLKDIAEVIGRRLNVPVVGISAGEAAAHFGFFGYFVGLDCPASSALTRERLGWRPVQPGLLADLERAHNLET